MQKPARRLIKIWHIEEGGVDNFKDSYFPFFFFFFFLILGGRGGGAQQANKCFIQGAICMVSAYTALNDFRRECQDLFKSIFYGKHA